MAFEPFVFAGEHLRHAFAQGKLALNHGEQDEQQDEGDQSQGRTDLLCQAESLAGTGNDCPTFAHHLVTQPGQLPANLVHQYLAHHIVRGGFSQGPPGDCL
ncbi:MAG: hypothetical protein DVS81_14245 [Candidatus Accumulibacter meliphilus]|uniref:Uncharacterized protein n=1 Tax=Candidatus Accumulibacter meliphilus TaxID=2211374 RepID=A0A369XN87_9PROT|nr:MAG: hypothetical protein DVS81_14245 [Candidatus Accumulibacter meliphilus]